MSGNYYSPFPLRVPEELIEKMKYIANLHKRSTNKEIEFILENYINDFEEENGEITVEL